MSIRRWKIVWVLFGTVVSATAHSTTKRSLHYSPSALLQIHIDVSKVSKQQHARSYNNTVYEISLDRLTDDVGDRRRNVVTLDWSATKTHVSSSSDHSFIHSCYNGTAQHDVVVRASSSWMVVLWENHDTLLTRRLVHLQTTQPVRTVLLSSHTVHDDPLPDRNDHGGWEWTWNCLYPIQLSRNRPKRPFSRRVPKQLATTPTVMV